MKSCPQNYTYGRDSLLLYTLADSGQKLQAPLLLPLKIQWRPGCKIELIEQKDKLDATNFSF